KVGITFASTLRHILRQGPDIIMVGEMRDRETGEQAIQAALTGHLVLSTLHTNDCASTLTRLLELGLESYLVNATLVGIVAQRLVRNICPYCKTGYSVDAAELQNRGMAREAIGTKQSLTLWYGAGCEHCRRTGYYGRSAIFEMLPFDQDFQEALRLGSETDAIRQTVRQKGIKGLLDDGFEKVKQGLTTLEEVLRVAV
ncbi:MAG: Flp pilus assembly complex ATPase component TadA, partial [Desulfohalobiaceae bacterium]|nr:Flp pilus assembly complex ATPase component TadA [Desulfohalobiaceae bacterium]